VELALGNNSAEPLALDLSWTLDADFADVQEAFSGERQQHAPVEVERTDGTLVFRYRHAELPLATRVLGEGAAWRATLLRFQNVYGDGQSLRNPYTGVLSIFARQLLEGADLAIFEDGDIARDFVFVDDVVDALVRAGGADLAHGTIIDIGLGQAATILAVAKSLMRALGRGEDSYRVTGAFRVGDIRHACADIGAAARLLGWAPRVGIDEGLRQLARWAQAQHANGGLA
jgi:dTDP-L-rhamnose 4-epimerase